MQAAIPAICLSSGRSRTTNPLKCRIRPTQLPENRNPTTHTRREAGESDEESPLSENIARVRTESAYPERIKKKEWWVTWILDEVGRKRPVAPWKDGHAYPTEWNGDLPEEEKPHTDFETAKRWVEFNLDHAGLELPPEAQSDELDIGILLPNDRPPLSECISLIDWDDIRDPDTGEIHPVAAQYMRDLGGYVEISTSGTGAHQLVGGGLRKRGKFIAPIDDEPFIGDDLPQVEIYDGGRHVAMTGRHVQGTDLKVVDDQSYIDSIISEYAEAEKDAGHRVYDPESGEYDGDTPKTETETETPDSHAGAVPDPSTGEYMGPPLAALKDTKPENRSLAYHVAVETFYRGGGNAGGYAHVQNWRLEGFVAALGERDDLTREQVKDDLSGAYLDETAVECGCSHDTPHRVDYGFKRAETGRLAPPSHSTLVAYGVLPPEAVEDESSADTDEHDDETGRDLLELDVVVEPAHALAAAEAVEPDDLDRELPALQRADVDSVAIAVALTEGWIDSPNDFPEDGRYTEAYYRARDHFGAPLPKYLDNTTLEKRTDLVFAALDRVEPRHIYDGMQSEVTVADPSGKAEAKINPTWEDSESEERILAGYGRGFYCVEHSDDVDGPSTFDALQVVALEHGLVEDEFSRPRGDAFTRAYRLLRTEYDAPIPRWRATLLEHVAVLPAATRILDDDLSADTDRLSLAAAREQTEALLRNAVDVNDRAQLVTCLPGTGKSYGAVAVAADRPALYCTQRNDLKKQIEQYVEAVTDDDIHADDLSAAHLPILTDDILDDELIESGVAAVLEDGSRLLRLPGELLARVGPFEDEDDAEESHERAAADLDSDEPVLQRPTCSTASGVHGDDWQFRTQVAHALGFNPADLHRYAPLLFGESLPCQHASDHDEHESCEMSRGWDRVRDPDNPIDLLIGSPEHAFVDSATTYFERGPDGDRESRERAVFFDEFPGEAFFNQYDDRYVDRAVWLADALRGIDTREDLLDAGLESDTWVNHWIDGEGTEVGHAADAHDTLSGARDILDAAAEAERIQEQDLIDDARGLSSFNIRELRSAVEDVAERDLQVDDEAGSLSNEETLADGCETYDSLVGLANIIKTDADRTYAGDGDAGPLYALHDALTSILESLASGARRVGGFDPVDLMQRRIDALPVGGDMERALEAAVDAVNGDAPEECIDTALTILEGGRDGCRALALAGEDGYAHPNAWALLAGVVAPDEQVSTVAGESFTFDPVREGGSYKSFERNGARILADKNHHGALVRDAPSFTDVDGTSCPVIGLDATGRTTLWRIAIGRDTERLDIHETPAARRRFLRECMQLRVVQTSDEPLSYHSDPSDKNFQEDIELVRAVADKYTGDEPGALDDKGPAVLSTLKVLHELGCDPQSDPLDPMVQAHEPDTDRARRAGSKTRRRGGELREHERLRRARRS